MAVAKILVIDDDEIMNSMLLQLLTNAGHSVCGAPDGRIGLELFQDKRFDLVVTDIVMPEKEGLELILGIRKQNKKIPIIAISGGGRMRPEGYLSLAQKFGADYTFEKPIDKERFLAAIRECLEENTAG